MELNFERLGRGRPVILLHPAGLDRTFWETLPERLSTNHTVVSVDLRGHGLSADGPRPGRMADYLTDVIKVIEAIDLGPASLVGVSFGGMIAQNVAGLRPDLVSRIVVAGCPLFIPAAAHLAIRSRGSDAESGGMIAVVDRTLERWFSEDYLPSESVARVRQRLLTDNPSGFAAAWEAICEHDARDLLPNFSGPTLVIAGENDQATSVEAMAEIAKAAKDAEMTILAGAPHIMQLEKATAFGDLVCDFLAREIG